MNDKERLEVLRQDTFKNITLSEYEQLKPVLKRLRPSELLQLQANALSGIYPPYKTTVLPEK